MRAKNAPTWFDYWKENMEALGYTIPTTWSGGTETILARIGLIVAAVEKFGSRVTVAELVGAGALTEEFLFVGAGLASLFVGAAIGSAAVATGRTLSGGTSLADVLEFAASKWRTPPEVKSVIMKNPQVYQRNFPGRFAYARMAQT
jgi:hypothetical protein